MSRRRSIPRAHPGPLLPAIEIRGREAFRLTQERIAAMARVHEGIYRIGDPSAVDFDRYLHAFPSRRRHSKSLGCQLVVALAARMRGRVRVGRGKGTSVSVSFPLSGDRERTARKGVRPRPGRAS